VLQTEAALHFLLWSVTRAHHCYLHMMQC